MNRGREQHTPVTGGCHCRRVRFEVMVGRKLTVHRCNCSICALTDFLHLIVPRDRFRLLGSDESLTEYRFNTGVARHWFCSVCGVKSFYLPRSHPDSYSVNLRCIDLPPDIVVTIEAFDGKNWEQNVGQLASPDRQQGP